MSSNLPLPAFSEAHILMEVEKWVEMPYPPAVFKKMFIEWGNSFADFKDIRIIDYLSEEDFQQLAERLPRFLSVFHESYQYSEHYSAFLAGCLLAGIPFGAAEITSKYYPEPVQPSFSIEQLKILVDTVQQCKYSPGFQRRAKDRLYQMKDKNEHLLNYATAVHASYSKILVVRIDLAYTNESMPFITIAEVNRHLNKLLKKKDSNCREFKELIGYAWTMEQGEDKGYHIHCVFYFNGHKRQNDTYIGYAIGELWRKITSQQGRFYNCNDHKENYSFLGIGMIHASQPEAIAYSLKAVGYLASPAKQEQYLRAYPKKSRAFGTGLIKGQRSIQGNIKGSIAAKP